MAGVFYNTFIPALLLRAILSGPVASPIKGSQSLKACETAPVKRLYSQNDIGIWKRPINRSRDQATEQTQNTGNHVSGSQSKDTAKIAIEDRRLLYKGHFAIEINICDHKIFIFLSRGIFNGGDHSQVFDCICKIFVC